MCRGEQAAAEGKPRPTLGGGPSQGPRQILPVGSGEMRVGEDAGLSESSLVLAVKHSAWKTGGGQWGFQGAEQARGERERWEGVRWRPAHRCGWTPGFDLRALRSGQGRELAG